MNNVVNANQPRKKSPPKPVVDERKEQMKRDLFSGVSAAKSSDSDDDDKPAATTAAPATNTEVNLLDFDMGPSTTPAASNNAPVEQSSGNLLDLMDDTPTQQPVSQPMEMNTGLDSVLGAFTQPQQPVQAALRYQAVPNFTTALFG